MADVNVISVNPGKKTLGALNLEFVEKMARTCRPITMGIHSPRTKTICNFIFGINKYVSSSWSSKLWLLRSVIAVYFISVGILAIMSGAEGIHFGISVANIVMGGMIFLGFLARISATAGFLLYASAAVTAALGYVWHLSSSEIPVFETETVMQALLMLVIAVAGPGRYSVDQLLRRFIFRKAKYRALRRSRIRNARDISARLSYKAWQAML